MSKKYVHVVTEMMVRASDSSRCQTRVLGVYSSKGKAIEVMKKAAHEKKAELDRNLKGTRFEEDVEMSVWNEGTIIVAETYGGDADSFTYSCESSIYDDEE